jgi:hypothetical protein
METLLHVQTVGVWYAISLSRIISPISFEDTIDSERCCELILNQFIGHLNEYDVARSYFQQDDATPHMALLRDVFAERLISRDIWPPRSPDLSHRNFYLLGAMKALVYKDNPA